MQTVKRVMAILIILGVGLGMAYVAGMNSRDLSGGFKLFWFLCALSFGIQIFGFLFSSIFKTESLYDLTGSLTFLSLTFVGLFVNNSPSYIQYVAAFMIVIWTSRLGAFLFFRILNSGGDSRFDEIKQSHLKFFVAWLGQGLWVIITASPLLVLISKPVQTGSIHALEVIGLILWIFGLIFQTIADYQKSAFKEKKENNGKFINVGLWSISRHPNYFGQITLWTGASLYAIPSLVDWEFVSMVSPLFVCCLIVFVSGLPMLEKKADEKWGKDKEYIEYKRNTPVLVPFTCGDTIEQSNINQLPALNVIS